MMLLSRTLATPYLLGILLCSSLFWRRAASVPMRINFFRHSESDRTEDALHVKRPNILDRVGFYLLLITTGILCALMTAFLFLLMSALIDTLSKKDPRVKSERVKRSRIPKIVLDRAIQNQDRKSDDEIDEDDDDDDDDDDTIHGFESFRPSRVEYSTDGRGTSVNEKRLTQSSTEENDLTLSTPPKSSPSQMPNSDSNQKVLNHSRADYLRWLKSIYLILQITHAVQPHLQERTTLAIEYKQSKPL